MKVRCIDNFGCRKLTLGKIYTVINEKEEYYKVKNDAGIELLHYKNRFEIVKEENKMEKTFREVIATIKEGEIWENEIYSISKDADGLSIKRLDKYIQKDIKDTPYMYLYDKTLFELQRKQYTFEEAFKAFEEGKEIESCEGSCYKYKRMNNSEFVFIKENEHWLEFAEHEEVFSFNEIRGKWYIND